MTDALVAQTAVQTYDQPPRADQLPDGWGVRDWRVTRYRDWECDHIEIECTFAHVAGALVGLLWKVKDRPADYGWLSRYLVVSQDVPMGLSVQTEQRKREWWER